jgi:hypothetical protein
MALEAGHVYLPEQEPTELEEQASTLGVKVSEVLHLFQPT